MDHITAEVQPQSVDHSIEGQHQSVDHSIEGDQSVDHSTEGHQSVDHNTYVQPQSVDHSTEVQPQFADYSTERVTGQFSNCIIQGSHKLGIIDCMEIAIWPEIFRT